MSASKLCASLVGVAIVASACAQQPTATATGAPLTRSVAPAESVAPEPADPEEATVRIESEGEFYEPLSTVSQATFTGSGFIIDSSGLVVTNHHVVGGGTAWKVFVGGDEPPLIAQLLGSSECDDLAVLQIRDVPDDLPALEWHDGEVEPGLEVHAAGFPPNPEGDFPFRLQPGEVTTAASALSTDWAAIDTALEHSATIRGGNSGGPLISDEDGTVVGVNYAATGTDSYAIASDRAQTIIETLASGRDIDSIGISGQAIASEDGSLFGIWVVATKRGSPADNAGIRAGDLLTEINGVEIGTDGTMRQYCDILRSQGTTAQLDISLINFDEEACYVAFLNSPSSNLQPFDCGFTTADDPMGAVSILQAYAPPGVAASCVDGADETYSGAVGSVTCAGPPGVEALFYDLFPDAASMRELYDSLSAEAGVVGGGDCSVGPGEAEWTGSDGTVGGRYACWERSDGFVTLLWTDDRNLVVGTAIAASGGWSILLDAFFNGEI